MSLLGTPRGSMIVKNNPITDDYKISSNVLGLGINGKVVECFDTSGEKFALKVLKDNVKSRREIDLHWRASGCRHIVNIKDVYDNTYNGQRCLLLTSDILKEENEQWPDVQQGMSVALREMRVDQDQPFTVKNPKLDSNSALAKKRRAKTGAPPT